MTFNLTEEQSRIFKMSIDNLMPVISMYLTVVRSNQLPDAIINVLGINQVTIEFLLQSLSNIFEILEKSLNN